MQYDITQKIGFKTKFVMVLIRNDYVQYNVANRSSAGSPDREGSGVDNLDQLSFRRAPDFPESEMQQSKTENIIVSADSPRNLKQLQTYIQTQDKNCKKLSVLIEVLKKHEFSLAKPEFWDQFNPYSTTHSLPFNARVALSLMPTLWGAALFNVTNSLIPVVAAIIISVSANIAVEIFKSRNKHRNSRINLINRSLEEQKDSLTDSEKVEVAANAKEIATKIKEVADREGLPDSDPKILKKILEGLENKLIKVGETLNQSKQLEEKLRKLTEIEIGNNLLSIQNGKRQFLDTTWHSVLAKPKIISDRIDLLEKEFHILDQYDEQEEDDDNSLRDRLLQADAKLLELIDGYFEPAESNNEKPGFVTKVKLKNIKNELISILELRNTFLRQYRIQQKEGDPIENLLDSDYRI